MTPLNIFRNAKAWQALVERSSQSHVDHHEVLIAGLDRLGDRVETLTQAASGEATALRSDHQSLSEALAQHRQALQAGILRLTEGIRSAKAAIAGLKEEVSVG